MPETFRRKGGFALIIVLWALVLIGFIAARVTASGRTEVRIAKNLIANAAAETAADGAIWELIFNLSSPSVDQHWPIDGSIHDLVVGDCHVSVRLEDEAWRINPSLASPALLQTLLRAVVSDSEVARRLAVAIAEWVGSVPVARQQSEVLSDYRAAGLDYGPPGEALESLDELGRVLGMTPSLLAAIRPHLSLFAPPEPSPAAPDPVVAVASIEAANAGPPSPANQPPPDVSTIRITAIASGPSNALAIRSAIVRFGAMLPGVMLYSLGAATSNEVTRPRSQHLAELCPLLSASH